MIDINCNPLVDILFCVEEFFLVLTLKILFDILLRLHSKGLETLLLRFSPNTRLETVQNLLDNSE